jgi:hypothetical protein
VLSAVAAVAGCITASSIAAAAAAACAGSLARSRVDHLLHALNQLVSIDALLNGQ